MRTEKICRIEDDGTQTPMVLVPADESGGVRLNADSVRVLCEALDVGAGMLKGAGDGLRNLVEYARGLLMPATMFHDAGAAAFCQRCKRYTTDLRALRSADDPSCTMCNCGEKHYWTGSFATPTRDSKWSLP